MNISAADLGFKELNELVKNTDEDLFLDTCYGQRFIGTGARGKTIRITGTPGNALGAYLDGAVIEVEGNVQDAVGDTMNDGKIIVHGNAGDALGYAMRGGSIFVLGDSGYRTGIHMKEYKERKPVIVIGGKVGSFLGEYLAGGIIIVLGLDADTVPMGNFTGTGMHGGKIFIRTKEKLSGKAAAANLPEQVAAELATSEDMKEIEPYISEFAEHFGQNAESLMNDEFYLLKPNTKNPYQRLYATN